MTTWTTEDRENASPPHIVDSGASVMKDEPVAYINVEERKLEWAKPMTWHTPTIAQMDKIPLYTHSVIKELETEIFCLRKQVEQLLSEKY
jgi:hypothetical protein